MKLKNNKLNKEMKAVLKEEYKEFCKDKVLDILLATVLNDIESESYYRFNLGICLAEYKENFPQKYKVIADFFRQVKEVRKKIKGDTKKE